MLILFKQRRFLHFLFSLLHKEGVIISVDFMNCKYMCHFFLIFSFLLYILSLWSLFCLLDWPVVLVRICNSSTQKGKTGIALLIPYIVYQELHNAKQGILGFMIKHYLKIQSKEEGRISIFWLVIAANISP